MRSITLHEMPYTVEDDGAGGSQAVNQQDEPDTQKIWLAAFDVDETPVSVAVGILRDEGITQDNGHWFGDPDPDATMNPYTGEYVERTAWLDGFTDDELDAISAQLR